MEKQYRPAWRGFYKHILAMIVIFIVACVVTLSFSIGWKWGTVIWAVGLLICLGLVANMWLKRACMVLSVRADEVAFDTGLLKRKSTEISYQNLRTIDVSQTIAQRILNLGTLSIASSGTSGYEINAKDIVDPFGVRNEIQDRERAMKAKATGAAQPTSETPSA
ncbi:MAG: PH domain-containing protein [Synergistaceae bacterium]|nr:PH domain-containing protein [Synergistaceae bacterium]